MKKAVIVALAALNVGLLAWVLTMYSDSAHAQRARGQKEFLQVSGKIGKDVEATYILDVTTRNLKGWYYSAQDKKMVELRGRDLANDFRRGDK